MIEGIRINGDEYLDFELTELTDNNIIFFSSPHLKNKIVIEFWKILDGRAEKEESNVDYCLTEDDEKLEIVDNIVYLPTTIIRLKNQTFVFTVEAPFIFQAKDRYDIWFVDENSQKEISSWSFINFIGHKETWDKGLYIIYREFICGRYGCYNGYRNM